MKIKTILSLIIVSSFMSYISAQTLINKGANITISSGSSLVIKGDFENQLDGAVNNSGNMMVSGDWINNQTSGSLLNGTTGTVVMNGSGAQSFSGPAATFFNNLTLQNNVSLAGPADISVASNLSLAGAFLYLNNANVVMQNGSAIVGAGPASYLITGGTGKLKQYVSASNVSFPIGTISAFVPAVLNNTGTADFFGARVFADVRANGLSGATIPEINDCVNMTWDISEQTAGGSNLAVTANWGAAIEGPNFDRAHAGIGHYTGGSWDPQGEQVASGANPYSITRSGINTLSAFAVGDLESPMAIPLDLRIDLTAFLEGPFNGVSMDNDLNATGLLPLNQPYNVAPINYFGSESVAAIPNANIIDWVLVELRDATSAANATGATVVEQKALFLRNDGAIVDLDGTSIPNFSSTITNNLYVVVRHRNHVAIMTANAVTQSGGIYSYNFTTSVGQAYGGSAGHKQIAAGVWGMFSANGYPDQFIILHDRDFVWDPQAGSSGYLNGDFDMDTQVDNVDKDDHWVENTGAISQVPN